MVTVDVTLNLALVKCSNVKTDIHTSFKHYGVEYLVFYIVIGLLTFHDSK